MSTTVKFSIEQKATTPIGHNLKRPCANCPFRKDTPCEILPETAVEISLGLQQGAVFVCHKTVTYAAEGFVDGKFNERTEQCAGSAILLTKMGSDLESPYLDMNAPVVDDYGEFVALHLKNGKVA
jgi:hypothetical protein